MMLTTTTTTVILIILIEPQQQQQMNGTHRQGAWYDRRRQAFVGLKGTRRNSSNRVHNHIPPDSGCNTNRREESNTWTNAALECEVHLLNIPA